MSSSHDSVRCDGLLDLIYQCGVSFHWLRAGLSRSLAGAGFGTLRALRSVRLLQLQIESNMWYIMQPCTMNMAVEESGEMTLEMKQVLAAASF